MNHRAWSRKRWGVGAHLHASPVMLPGLSRKEAPSLTHHGAHHNAAGANFPLDLETPPKAHAVRLAFQPVLMAMLWELTGDPLEDFDDF